MTSSTVTGDEEQLAIREQSPPVSNSLEVSSSMESTTPDVVASTWLDQTSTWPSPAFIGGSDSEAPLGGPALTDYRDPNSNASGMQFINVTEDLRADYKDPLNVMGGGTINYLNPADFMDEINETFFNHRKPATAVLIGLYSLSFLVGIVGNLLVVYIFARNRHMRTVTNSFLVNLAVCDLLVVCLCMPFSVAMEIYANWIYGDVMCKVVNFSQGLSVASSVLTLAVISAERFYAIRRPLRARAFMARSRIQKIIISIWILASIAVLPSVFVRKEKVVEIFFDFSISTCVEEWKIKPLKYVYNFALTVLLYIAPVLFICVGYLQIGMNLWRSQSFLHAGTNAAESENARTNLSGRRKVAKMLFVMALLFALSWLPLQILQVTLDFISESMLVENGIFLRHLHSYFLWLGHTNSAINPICYCIMSTSFKCAIRFELRRCCSCFKNIEFRRESFRSMSMSITMTTNNGSTPGHYRGAPARHAYHPVTNGCSPDILKGVRPSAMRTDSV